jgi:hypothetical protein
VQQGAEPLAPGVVQFGARRLGPLRALTQAIGAGGVEGTGDVADGLSGATDRGGDM